MSKGRPAKGRQYPASLQIPCTEEFKSSVEHRAKELGMTPPEFMRRAIEAQMKPEEKK